jgi:hypothetical protein
MENPLKIQCRICKEILNDDRESYKKHRKMNQQHKNKEELLNILEYIIDNICEYSDSETEKFLDVLDFNKIFN